MDLVRRRLFPFRLERWLALGFVSFLDGCGRGAASGGFQLPGGPGGAPGGGGLGGRDGAADLAGLWAWIGEYLGIILAVAALALMVIVALVAVVLWINSRGVFMYLDDVATGRFEVVRPWREHRDRAWSYFGWSFGVAMAGLLALLMLLMPLAWMVVSLVSGATNAGAIAAGLGSGCLLVLLMVALSLFSLVLRDFAAPLQVSLGVSCGRALREAGRLIAAHPGAFAAYLGLKIAFSIAAGIVAFLTGCFTCCIGFLPVISHTLLQPILYFERAWSLSLLRQAGHDPFPAEAAPPPPGGAQPASA
ncbi:MAG TPA: hypothetical protein VMT16_15595 [Thermoanaerobaculia bacterium]|nr:hypothetical protein [Thermoanaerobaculia bacterium]